MQCVCNCVWVCVVQCVCNCVRVKIIASINLHLLFVFQYDFVVEWAYLIAESWMSCPRTCVDLTWRSSWMSPPTHTYPISSTLPRGMEQYTCCVCRCTYCTCVMWITCISQWCPHNYHGIWFPMIRAHVFSEVLIVCVLYFKIAVEYCNMKILYYIP